MIDALRSRPGNGLRAAALALLVCALALRLLVPAGWMPVRDARGLHLTLCSGSGPMEMPAGAMPGMDHAMAGDAAHHGPHDRDQGMQDHACPFASLSLAITAPPLPEAPLPVRPVLTSPGEAAFAVAIGRGLAAPPPPPTGPPALG